MSRRVQLVVFVVLLAVLAWLVASQFGRGPELGGVLFANEKYVPLKVDDPTLRIDLLERAQKLEYKGTKRNIFSASAPPKPRDPEPPAPVVVQKEPIDTAPPPLVVPFRFYGYEEDPRSGRRRAFFLEGENVLIAAVGDTLQNRFRLLKIANQSAEVEELASGRRATLQLEPLPQS
jgi:hypothetical protein